MRRLLPLPVLLTGLFAACAPALTAPAPQPGEVVIAAVNTLPSAVNNTLSLEQNASVVTFADIGVLLVVQRTYSTGLPPNYDEFSFPKSDKSIRFLNADVKDAPIHGLQDWEAKQKDGPGVVEVHWESQSLKGQFVSVRVRATSTDPAVNTRQVEDALLNRLYKFNGISFVASGR